MKKIILFASILLTVNLSYGLGQDVSGGDECEDRIQNISNDIKSWINAGGAKGLNLPGDISLERYSQSMISQISSAKVSCISEKIIIDKAEKTCANYIDADSGQSIIECNIERFNNHTSEAGQYRLVHHEYAGLAGIENTPGQATSNYEISNQLTLHLKKVTNLKLVITPETTPKPKPVPSELIKVCRRSKEIRQEILKLTGRNRCDFVTDKDLLSITEIAVDYQLSASIHPGEFSGFKSLQKVELYINSSTRELPENLFTGLNSLEAISIKKSERIKSLPENIFYGLSNLKEINLFANDFHTLPSQLFKGHNKLEKLSLRSCSKLADIPRNAFFDLVSLKDLDINSLRTRDMYEDWFMSLVNLQKLAISTHALTYPPHIFASLRSLKTLSLGGPYINELPASLLQGLNSIEKIYIGAEELQNIPQGLFDNLKTLKDLSIRFTPLESLPNDVFKDLQMLEYFGMTSDELYYLDPEQFSPLKSIKRIDLVASSLSKRNIQQLRTKAHQQNFYLALSNIRD